MAGAAIEMTDALLINPNDTEEIKQAICRALEMPEQEQLKRLQHMQKIISVQTVNNGAIRAVRMNSFVRKGYPPVLLVPSK